MRVVAPAGIRADSHQNGARSSEPRVPKRYCPTQLDSAASFSERSPTHRRKSQLEQIWPRSLSAAPEFLSRDPSPRLPQQPQIPRSPHAWLAERTRCRRPGPFSGSRKYMSAPPSAAAMMMPVTPGTQFGPPPSVQSPRPKPRFTPRTKGRIDSAAWDTSPPTSKGGRCSG